VSDTAKRQVITDGCVKNAPLFFRHAGSRSGVISKVTIIHCYDMFLVVTQNLADGFQASNPDFGSYKPVA